MGSERSNSQEYSPTRRTAAEGIVGGDEWPQKQKEIVRESRNMRGEEPTLFDEGRPDRRDERYIEEGRRASDEEGLGKARGVDDAEDLETGARGGGSQRNGFSLLIRNLDRNTRPDKIRGAFEQFGEVRDVYLPQDHYSRRPRGFGFVEFLHEEDAINAMAELNDSDLDGSRISVLKANEKRKSPDEMKYRDPRRDRESRHRRREHRGPQDDREYRNDDREYRNDETYGGGRGYHGGGRDRHEDSRYERGGGGGSSSGYGGGNTRPYYRDEHRGNGGAGRSNDYYDRSNNYRDRSHSPRSRY